MDVWQMQLILVLAGAAGGALAGIGAYLQLLNNNKADTFSWLRLFASCWPSMLAGVAAALVDPTASPVLVFVMALVAKGAKDLTS